MESEHEIADVFVKFYKNLFSTSSPREHWDILEFVNSVITEEDNRVLMSDISDMEIKNAAFQMGGLKAPGPDGFSGIFYHSSWSTVGPEVTKMVKDFFKNGADLFSINVTNIVLIPKIEDAASVNHFRPISLCNFAYKVISKVKVNRMKTFLPKCISLNQRAFVPGRLIQDNILVAHEAYHHLKNKKKGRSFEMAVKVDMNKAYDRIEWGFVKRVLIKLGFCVPWVERIMLCLSSVKYSLLLSGKKVGSIVPERGLRQGDPLSPYLFIIAADVLSNLVTAFASVNEFEGIKLARNCPILTHCFFADDAVFFMKASPKNARMFRKMLDWYCDASGQLINLEKSCIFFSENTPNDAKDEISDCLGISDSKNPGNYLGLLVLWGRSKSDALNFVKEKMLRKIQGWKQSVLSQAGREILIKSVANAVPMYPMCCFNFPKKVCNSFNNALANFWWGQQKNEGKIHWKSWEKLAEAKKDGGMGFRDFESFNIALLAKQCWRIVTCPNEFWVQILKGIYFPNDDFLCARKGGRASWAWSSLLEGRNLLLKGLCWQVGDGASIDIWKDAWIPGIKGGRLTGRPLDTDCNASLVKDLIVDGSWFLDEILQWISPADTEAILVIPISGSGRSDRLMWSPNKNGKYYVSSGYAVAFSDKDSVCTVATCSSTVPNNLWKALWNLKVPPKVKNFLWKACNAAVPTNGALFRRRCKVSAGCPVCADEAETMEHMILFCEWARVTWFSSALSIKIDKVGFSSFENWCWGWMVNNEDVDDETKSFIAILCWEIWKSRCQHVFQGHKVNPVLTCIRAASLHAEFWSANLKHTHADAIPVHNTVANASCHWEKPAAGVIKFNIDGAFTGSNDSAGIGVVVRDHFGAVIDGLCTAVHSFSALVVEALALLRAFLMASNLKIKHAIFETDCLELVNSIHSTGSEGDWRCGSIFADITSLLHANLDWKLSWIPRHLNHAADWVAKRAVKKMCPLDWVCTPPSSLALILSRDLGLCTDAEDRRVGVG